MRKKQCQEGLLIVLKCGNYAFTDKNERRTNEGKAVIKIMTNTKCLHATVRAIIGGLTVRDVCCKARPEVQVSNRRIEEPIGRCVRCLW